MTSRFNCPSFRKDLMLVKERKRADEIKALLDYMGIKAASEEDAKDIETMRRQLDEVEQYIHEAETRRFRVAKVLEEAREDLLQLLQKAPPKYRRDILNRLSELDSMIRIATSAHSRESTTHLAQERVTTTDHLLHSPLSPFLTVDYSYDANCLCTDWTP